MIGQNGGKLVFVLGLQKVFDGPCWKGCECFIGRSKDGKGTFAFERLDKPSRLYGRNQRPKGSRFYGGINDVFFCSKARQRNVPVTARARKVLRIMMDLPTN